MVGKIAAPADGSVTARTEFSAQTISSATAYTTDLATVRKMDLVARALGNRTAMSGSVHPGLFDWFARCPLWPQQPPCPEISWVQTRTSSLGAARPLPPSADIIGRHVARNVRVGVSSSEGSLLSFSLLDNIAPFTINTRSRELVFHTEANL